MNIRVIKQSPDWNEDCSNEIRAILKEKGVYLINVMGSPGTGKTSFIIELIKKLKDKYEIGVIEGDIAGKVDAEKIDALGIHAIQLNTEGACHIEPMSIKNILGYFDLDEIDLIFIENIGNLVCPAEFDVGEDLKVAILSVPEGDDKVEKYPLIFSTANAVILNKYDMMEHFDFDDNRVEEEVKALNESSEVFRISTRTGEEIDSFVNFVEREIQRRVIRKD